MSADQYCVMGLWPISLCLSLIFLCFHFFPPLARMNVFPGKMNKFLIEKIGVLHNFLAIFQKIIVHPFQQIEFEKMDCICLLATKTVC